MSMYLVNPYSYPKLPLISLDDLKAYYTFGDSGNQLNTASTIGSTDAIADSTITLSGNTTSGETGHVSGVDAIGFPTYDQDGNYATSSNDADDYDFMVTDGAVWTICFWASISEHGTYQTTDIWGFTGNGASNDIQFRYLNNDRFTIWFAGNEVTSFTQTITDTNWHFYVVSWDEPNGNASFTVDNGTTQTVSSVTTSNTSSPDAPLRFGDTSGNEFEGYMQLVILYNRILTTAEITKLWNSGAGTEL
tara:strand:+ start:135 stop:878 length:744 start_codon:yes stop_codon:yes gene_type:complete